MRMFFMLPSWGFAVAVSIIGSMLTVLGFVMQKQAVAAKDERYQRIGEVVLSPKWLTGFFFCVISPLPGDLLAYYLAPLSLTAPLSGISVALNVAIAPKFLGEKVQLWPDVHATILILSGSILTSVTGAHSEQGFNGHQLQELAVQPSFIIALMILVLLLISCLAMITLHAVDINEAARVRPVSPPIFHVVLPALLAAGFGGLTNIAMKGVSHLLSTGTWFEVIILSLIGVAPFAAVQLNFINMGLRLYLQTIFFPIYNSLLVLMNTVYGAIFYKEYVELALNPNRCALFGIGVMLIACGIKLFSFREPQSDAMKHVDDPVECSLQDSERKTRQYGGLNRC